MKKEIPFIGKVWGSISNACVHTNRRFFGPEFTQDEDGDTVPTVSLDLRARSPKAGQDTILLTFISLVAMILLKVLEDFLTEESDLLVPRGRRMVGTNLHLFGAEPDAMLMRYYQELTDSHGLSAEEEGEK